MDEQHIDTQYTEMHTQWQQNKAAAKEEAKVIQLIVFSLGDEEFAADISQIREIIRIGTITPIPDSPDFVKGLTNVRGEITVVIDLKVNFSLPTKKEVESKHIVITEQRNNLFGIMVDEGMEVLRIPETEIKDAPELVATLDRSFISGVIALGERLIMMLELSKVLSEEDLARLTKLQLEQHTEPQITQMKEAGEADKLSVKSVVEQSATSAVAKEKTASEKRKKQRTK